MKYQKDTIHNGDKMFKMPRYKYNKDVDGYDVTAQGQGEWQARTIHG